MTKLNKIEGIGAVFAQRFALLGIETLDDLLAAGKTYEDRKQLAAKVCITTRNVERWVSQADLARVKGIGEEYAELLRVAGIGSVKDLANSDPRNLLNELRELNRHHNKRVKRLPAISRVEGWVQKAGTIPTVVEAL